MMKILHLVHDWMFFDGVVDTFEGLPVECKFVCLKYGSNPSLTKIKRIDVVESVSIGSRRYDELLSSRWDYVWVHACDREKAAAVARLPATVKVIWSSWGYDYVRYYPVWMYSFQTSLLLIKAWGGRSFLVRLVGWLIGILHIAQMMPVWDCRFFRRVDFFSAVLKHENRYLRALVGKRARQIAFHYLSAKADIAYPKADLDAHRAWLGNSATLTNNHLYALQIMQQSMSDYFVDVPISYSLGNQEQNSVRTAVNHVGQKFFGNRLNLITEMMGHQEYVNQMSRCSVFVFAHRRQQSVGNISIAIRCGGCVILDERHPIMPYLSEIGVKVFSLRELRSRGIKAIIEEFRPFQSENIRRYNDARGREHMLEEIADTISYLEQCMNE